ncbi:MAG TPA: mechanosensitive ion channel family protein [Verrucomicrobiae bacterium]|jgi:MscS family membrane protein
MKKRFEKWYLALIVFWVVILVWSAWRAGAATQTTNALNLTISSTTSSNGVPASVTNAPAPPGFPEKQIEELAQQWPVLDYNFCGNPLWKYIFSLVYIFLAFYVSKLLDFLTRVWLKQWTQKTETQLDDLLLDLLNGPVKIIAFVIFLRIGLDVFQWPSLVQNILNKGFTVVVAATVTYVVMKLVDLLMGFWHQRAAANADKEFREQLFPLIRKSLKLFIIVVAALMTLNNMGVNITAALASLSIGGLAVGLAAQDTLANFFGAVAIFADRPFKIGDRIQIDGVDGMVETIGMRSTRVRSLDGYLVSIPNKAMNNATITNISGRPTIKNVINIGITYDTPTEKVKLALKIVEDIFRNHPLTADLVMSFNTFESSSLNILVVHWCKGTDVKASLAALQEMNLALKARFDAEKIDFAFPSQTIYLKPEAGK